MILDSKGNEIKIGETVSFENGKTLGVISSVLESPSDLQSWAVAEAGIMIESEPFGLLFLPVSSFVDDEVQIVTR